MKDNKLPIDVLRLIILEELEVDEDRVAILNQKWKIPTDEELFIAIDFKGSRSLSNRQSFVYDSGEYIETLDVNMREEYVVIIGSRNMDALRRKEEIVMALGSLLSQQKQEEYGFRIHRIAPIENMSGVEGEAILNRFDVPVTIHAWYQKTKEVGYFEKFPTEVHTERGLEAEFNAEDEV